MAEAETSRVGRRLAAIVAADVAGYSRLMGLDEVGTARTLREHRKVTDALVAKHGGRLVKSTGDGVLLEFPSVVDAVECAVAVQAVMAQRNEGIPQDRRMPFRIGINLGDILIEGDDILGDGVNIAARLEGIAEPGGICVSSSAYEQVRSKVEVEFIDLGEQTLKNIARPVQAFSLRATGEATISPSKGTALPLPDKPSIAVLPFQNMSGDPEQEYFADGMVEDIITELSRFKSLFVIARGSSFTYKGKVVDIKQVGRDLGVRYVLEGSVRKAGGRVRITGQLIDSTTGAHLWADRFDGALEDVFELQDKVTSSVVGQLFSRVQLQEEERAIRKPTNDLDAYDHYLRGTAKFWGWSKGSTEAAMSLFNKAIELDESFALAHAFAGTVFTLRKQGRWMVDVSKETAVAVHHARRAIELGREDGLALVSGGFTLAYVANDLDLGSDCIARGLSLNPNLSWGWQFSGWVNIYLGRHDVALEHLARAERLSPRDPSLVQVRLASALAYFFSGSYQEAVHLTKMVCSQAPSLPAAWRTKAISHALAGQPEDAAAAASKAVELDPLARVSVLVPSLPYRRLEDRERYRQGLLQAGFPD
ncbi:adenylate/guanylate cyclase domain-containing protein [Bradyrhizobium jicamae]|uniref:Adenylate/guanylate cyclase domain-containing protein n=1 Tax=Bradyrhizobium jicamae TaxID=280332 RepID=A0ABS5FNS2_9BRAD|nr:adenylate/guanylate cyclase domain-containing protein [Bradyrhizobium jicamae]MBR0797986.1 adenylate/guanylate cyclase domain-containing protein [Bradyrhizobium jicamae]